MGWGVNLMGYANVLETLQNLKLKFDGDTVYVVSSGAEYSVYVEYGTRNMQAQPFLRPAVKHVQNNMASIVEGADSEAQVVKKIAFAIERKASELAPVDTGNLKANVESRRIR